MYVVAKQIFDSIRRVTSVIVERHRHKGFVLVSVELLRERIVTLKLIDLVNIHWENQLNLRQFYSGKMAI